MQKQPKVSIVIPVYNGANYMREAIDSALAQTYPNTEIIVVNDGSTDDGATEQIALSYGDKIRYFTKENGGVSTALNLAIREMTGDFFSWLSHDDIYYPEKLQAQIDYLNAHQLMDEKVILYSNCRVIDEYGKVTSSTEYQYYEPNKKPEYAVIHGLVVGITLLIPKRAFDDHGPFDETYRCIQDYLKFYEFLSDYRYIFMEEKLAATRWHSQQVTNTSPRIMTENNYLWSMMADKLPLETKIRLEGSEYQFYVSMYEHIDKFYPYQEAAQFCKRRADEVLAAGKAALDKHTDAELIAAADGLGAAAAVLASVGAANYLDCVLASDRRAAATKNAVRRRLASGVRRERRARALARVRQFAGKAARRLLSKTPRLKSKLGGAARAVMSKTQR